MKLGYKVRKQGNSLMVSIPKHIQQLLKAADHIGIEDKKLEKLSERFNVTEEQVKRAILDNQYKIEFVKNLNEWGWWYA